MIKITTLKIDTTSLVNDYSNHVSMVVFVKFLNTEVFRLVPKKSFIILDAFGGFSWGGPHIDVFI